MVLWTSPHLRETALLANRKCLHLRASRLGSTLAQPLVTVPTRPLMSDGPPVVVASVVLMVSPTVPLVTLLSDLKPNLVTTFLPL